MLILPREGKSRLVSHLTEAKKKLYMDMNENHEVFDFKYIILPHILCRLVRNRLTTTFKYVDMI